MLRAFSGALLALAGGLLAFTPAAHAGGETHNNDTGAPVCVDVSSVPANTYIRIGLGDQLSGTLATQLKDLGQRMSEREADAAKTDDDAGEAAPEAPVAEETPAPEAPAEEPEKPEGSEG